MTPAERLARLLAIVGEAADILQGRVLDPSAPEWAIDRGWDGWLLALGDEAVARAESEGLAATIAPDAPPSLRALAARVREATTLSALHGPVEVRPLRRANDRKRAQVATLAEICRTHVRGARRVVDFGAGHGHLTRALAEALGIEAFGIERDDARVSVAERLTDDPTARFIAADARADALALSPEDFAVGLHACGALGDALIARAREAGSSALLVGCCLHKRPEPARLPLSALGRARGFTVPRALLGLGNLGDLYVGIERDIEAVMAHREQRRALYRFLRARGVALAPGDEVQKIHRRRFARGLAYVASEACALRGLPPPTDVELEDAARLARDDRARIRRLSLPRNMLGRALELAVAADRACALEDAGHQVALFEAFPAAASPRNVGLIATAAK